MLDVQQSLGVSPREAVKLAGVGVDWLTYTTKTGHQAEQVLTVADALARELMVQKGHTSKAMSLLGYTGYTVGQLFYGEREDGALVRASSETAHYLMRELVEGGYRGRASRIDIQCTVQFDTDREDYGRETAYTLAASSARKAKGRPPSLELHRGFGGGDTCTIGARSSARCLRLYDKTREQNHEVAPNLWRFEVEYKDDLAPRMYSLLAAAPDVTEAIKMHVAAEFMEQGVLIPWDEETDLERLRTNMDKTTVERQIAWLRKQVAPTLRRLERLGYEDEARLALYPKTTEDRV